MTPTEDSNEQNVEKPEKPNPVADLVQSLNSFLLQLDALFETQDRLMFILRTNEENLREECTQASQEMKKSVDLAIHEGARFPSAQYELFVRKSKELRKATEARRMMPHSFLVSMVSQYDAFFSSAVRRLFLLRPEKIRSGDRSISIKELVRHKSIDEVLLEIVNDEVDEILRGSHLDQLEWLQKKFDFKIDTQLPLVQRFIELTERRNICVHSDGRVSKYYSERCSFLNQDYCTQLAVGQWVPIGPKYLRQARDVLFEIGLRAIQTAWRKARPDQREKQSEMLVDICFELLELEDYELAKSIGAFALELRGVPDLDHKLLTINTAIAHKYSDGLPEVAKILSSVDWSASETRFKLAVAILRDDEEAATRLMEATPIKGDGAVTATAYRTWPLFKVVKKSDWFRKLFESRFGEPLDIQPAEVPILEDDTSEAIEGDTVPVLIDDSLSHLENET